MRALVRALDLARALACEGERTLQPTSASCDPVTRWGLAQTKGVKPRRMVLAAGPPDRWCNARYS